MQSHKTVPLKLLQPVPVQRHDVRDGGPGLLRFSATYVCHTGQQQVLREAGAAEEDQIAGPPPPILHI